VTAYQQEHDDLFDAIRNDKSYNEAENGAYSTLTAIMGRLGYYSERSWNGKDALYSEIDLHPDRYAWDALPKVCPGQMEWYPPPSPARRLP